MSDSHNSIDFDEPGIDNKEVYYSQEKQQYKQKLIDKKNSGKVFTVPEKSELLIQKIKSNEENKQKEETKQKKGSTHTHAGVSVSQSAS